jgi:hypothetical protein
MSKAELETVPGSFEGLPATQPKGICKHLGISMRRISGGAVWSNRPRTDVCRGLRLSNRPGLLYK